MSTISDELEYWKARAREIQEKNDLLERELQEYQENSVILERELESSYEQANRQNRELQSENVKLKVSSQIMKKRLSEHVESNNSMQNKLQIMQQLNRKLENIIQKLEDENEKLERQSREREISLKTLESQMDDMIEKLAITETELCDKTEGYKILVQRLKEENTDLKQQIKIDISQQGNKSNIVKGIELATNFQLSSSKRNSIGESNVSLSNLETMSKDELIACLRALVGKLDTPETTESESNELAEHDTTIKYNEALEKLANLETISASVDAVLPTAVAVKPAVTTLNACPDAEPIANEPTRVELRSQKKRKKSTDKTRPNSSIEEDERTLRSSVHSRLRRNIENRVKKVKEEETRQKNLWEFIGRLRRGRTGWLRKRD